MKYYLLTFNEDWADEHDVPALDCFTEEQYERWLEKPSGNLNPEYETQIANYHAYIKEREELNKKISDILGPRWAHVPYTQWPKELYEENKNLPSKYGYKSYARSPKKVINGQIYARLGNSGDSFEEQFEHLYLMKEFVEHKVVEVTEVNEDFHNTFHKANLKNLSLCNIFEL